MEFSFSTIGLILFYNSLLVHCSLYFWSSFRIKNIVSGWERSHLSLIYRSIFNATPYEQGLFPFRQIWESTFKKSFFQRHLSSSLTVSCIFTANMRRIRLQGLSLGVFFCYALPFCKLEQNKQDGILLTWLILL